MTTIWSNVLSPNGTTKWWAENIILTIICIMSLADTIQNVVTDCDPHRFIISLTTRKSRVGAFGEWFTLLKWTVEKVSVPSS